MEEWSGAAIPFFFQKEASVSQNGTATTTR
jgi:hypothetical protein